MVLTLACKGLLISDRCHVRFATLVEKKRGVRDDIKYTWTNLKIVRLGIPRTHGWVELVPTVPSSSSHRSSTVLWNLISGVKALWFCHHVCNVVMDLITFPENRLTTSGLQILLHGVISLRDATSYDKKSYVIKWLQWICIIITRWVIPLTLNIGHFSQISQTSPYIPWRKTLLP